MVNETSQTEEFENWLDRLRDITAAMKVVARIDATKVGNFGDCKPIGKGLSEMRIDYGPGYRIYYGQMDRFVYLLLGGGLKRSQSRDIARVQAAWKKIKESARDQNN